MAEDGVAELTIGMADAIVLLAVVSTAITTLADGLENYSLLLLAYSNSLLRLIILAAYALTYSWLAAQTGLEADAVELAAFATLAVAPV